MTTDYSAFKGESSPEKPVVRRARNGEPSTTVRIAVERHSFISWIVRGLLLGVGFSAMVRFIDLVMSWL